MSYGKPEGVNSFRSWGQNYAKPGCLQRRRWEIGRKWKRGAVTWRKMI
jgi:hypothetical protein